MDLERARYLCSVEGQRALHDHAGPLRSLDINARAKALRKLLPPAEAAAIGEQLALRERASGRLDAPGDWLLTAHGLEMMTHPLVARRRASRLAALGLPVVDLTCGLGGDLRALVEAGIRAAGVDRDPAAATLAGPNTGAPVAIGDAGCPPVALDRAAVLIDPSRRSEARRLFDPAAFEPTWATAITIASQAQAAVIKAPPGLPHDQLPAGVEVEFVQAGRSMREATVWFGPGAEAGLRRAVLLPVGIELDSAAPECPAEPVAPGPFVFDPESCVTRAGLVRQLGAQLGARLMDPQVAYLTAPAAAISPMATCLEVLDVVPFSVGALKALFRARGWRADEIRRRAFPIEPDELRRLLGRLEGEPVTLLCTTLNGRRTVIVARPVRTTA